MKVWDGIRDTEYVKKKEIYWRILSWEHDKILATESSILATRQYGAGITSGKETSKREALLQFSKQRPRCLDHGNTGEVLSKSGNFQH